MQLPRVQSFLYTPEIIVCPSDYGVTVHVQNFKLRVRFASTYIYENQSELIFPAERYGAFEPQGVYIGRCTMHWQEQKSIINGVYSKYEVVKIGSK